MSGALPTKEADRREMLDVLRGFALLGILLLNILGMGMASTDMFNPLAGIGDNVSRPLNLVVWAAVDIGFEGAMRAIFSMLFGAGVLLFTTDAAKTAGVYFSRQWWLLVFGLVDGFLLLWVGDILITYALCGMLLYFARHATARRLTIAGVLVLLLASAWSGLSGFGLGFSRDAAMTVAAAENPLTLPAETLELAQTWEAFEADYSSDAGRADELAARRAGYASAFRDNLGEMKEMLLFVLPTIMFWDALMMMLFGMAAYRSGIIQGDKPSGFYLRLMLAGFAVGLVINGREVWLAIAHDFDVLYTLGFLSGTYHFGRLAMAIGYLGLIGWLVTTGSLSGVRRGLAAVGRMALTNYLMQSAIALVLFTGVGFALVGELQRVALYGVVAGMWVVQIAFSLWWLRSHPFGPLEWLWRALTYQRAPAWRRDS